MAKKRVKLIIKGIVQGVNFRHCTKREAEKNNLQGWVRNLSDGSVGAIFEGEEEEVETMLQWCHHGPPSAHVTEVILQPEEYRGEFQSFAIKY
jgi:acylphosphatase